MASNPYDEPKLFNAAKECFGQNVKPEDASTFFKSNDLPKKQPVQQANAQIAAHLGFDKPKKGAKQPARRMTRATADEPEPMQRRGFSTRLQQQ